MSMKVTLVPGRELGPDLVRAWTEIQEVNPTLTSPYFHPEFTRVIAAVRDDVEVGVIEDGAQVVAFFPFQRVDASVGEPVGGVISDYQGLICAPDFACDPRELLQQCRLAAWNFDHLLTSQSSFTAFHHYTELSPQLDLSKGYESYASERRASGSEQIKKSGNLMRRLEREVGPLRLIAHTAADAPLQQTLAWKSSQYLKSGKPDLFAMPWVRTALMHVQAAQISGFAGMLSLLYAGERLVAGHFGMRGQSVWHYWFPAYEPDMAKYSPGLILLLKMAEQAPSLGVRTIDLGKGMSVYKQRLMNTSVPLASGSVELPSWRSVYRETWRIWRSRLRNSPFGPPARAAREWLRALHSLVHEDPSCAVSIAFKARNVLGNRNL
jgi:CelD/BcsL family acetyltransferase involved in cellulose biosynthesis